MELLIINLPTLVSYGTSLLIVWGIFILLMIEMTLKKSHVEKSCTITKLISGSIFTIVCLLGGITLLFPQITTLYLDSIFLIDLLITVFFAQTSYSLCLCNYNLLDKDLINKHEQIK